MVATDTGDKRWRLALIQFHKEILRVIIIVKYGSRERFIISILAVLHFVRIAARCQYLVEGRSHDTQQTMCLSIRHHRTSLRLLLTHYVLVVVCAASTQRVRRNFVLSSDVAISENLTAPAAPFECHYPDDGYQISLGPSQEPHFPFQTADTFLILALQRLNQDIAGQVTREAPLPKGNWSYEDEQDDMILYVGQVRGARQNVTFENVAGVIGCFQSWIDAWHPRGLVFSAGFTIWKTRGRLLFGEGVLDQLTRSNSKR